MIRWCRRSGLLFALGCAALLGGCGRRVAPGLQRRPEHGRAAAEHGRAAAERAPEPTTEPESAESRACAETLVRLAAQPALAGAAVNEGFVRGYLLGRARGEPVAFLRAPSFDPRRGSLQARALRAELSSAEHPAYAFERVLGKVKKSPALAREVFLTEGYLYSE